MNSVTLKSLNHLELAQYISTLDSIPDAVSQELARRFVLLVDTGLIEDDIDKQPANKLETKDAEIDELRSVISEAISVLESI